MSVLRNLLVLGFTVFVLAEPAVAEAEYYVYGFNNTPVALTVVREGGFWDFFVSAKTTLHPGRCLFIRRGAVERTKIYYDGINNHKTICSLGECNSNFEITLTGEEGSSPIFSYYSPSTFGDLSTIKDFCVRQAQLNRRNSSVSIE